MVKKNLYQCILKGVNMKKSFNKKLFTEKQWKEILWVLDVLFGEDEKQWKELGYTSDLAITVIYKNNEIFDLSINKDDVENFKEDLTERLDSQLGSYESSEMGDEELRTMRMRYTKLKNKIERWGSYEIYN